MKTKQILKKIGLISALSFSSIVFVSCDDDNNTTTNITDTVNDSGNNEGDTPLSSEFAVGGVFLADIGDGLYKFTVTSVNGSNGTGVLEVPFLDNFIAENIKFDYDGQNLLLTDNRLSNEEVITSLKQITGSGGEAENEFNAVIQNSTETNVDNFVSAVSKATSNYIVDHTQRDDSLFIPRHIEFTPTEVDVNGFSLKGTTSSTLSVGKDVSYNDRATFSYTAP